MKVCVTPAESTENGRLDPLLRGIELPLYGAYHPLGYRAEVTTNSPDVLEAARESWGSYGPQFECEPVSLRIVVEAEGEHAEEPAFRQQGHLLSIVSDRSNFLVGDLQTLSGCGFIARKTALDHAWLRWFFLESMVQACLEQRYFAAVHAACVASNETGVLLCGTSGAGKSTLAYACARDGWTYLGDESVHLLLDAEPGAALGKPHQVRFRPDARFLFPELHSYPATMRPNGRVSLEVPMCELPQIRTASRCQIGCVVFLDRLPGKRARAEAVSEAEAMKALLRDKPFLGEELWARHKATVRRLTRVPAYRMEYDQLGPAVELLSRLVGSRRPCN